MSDLELWKVGKQERVPKKRCEFSCKMDSLYSKLVLCTVNWFPVQQIGVLFSKFVPFSVNGLPAQSIGLTQSFNISRLNQLSPPKKIIFFHAVRSS